MRDIGILNSHKLGEYYGASFWHVLSYNFLCRQVPTAGVEQVLVKKYRIRLRFGPHFLLSINGQGTPPS
jgi:hypothetical protein